MARAIIRTEYDHLDWHESVFFIEVLLFLTEKSELEEKSITILDFAPIFKK